MWRSIVEGSIQMLFPTRAFGPTYPSLRRNCRGARTSEMRPTVTIDCFSEGFNGYGEGYAVVAVDVIRATTTAVTAVASSLAEAAERSRNLAQQASFRGKQLRRDIAWHELTRSARVT